MSAKCTLCYFEFQENPSQPGPICSHKYCQTCISNLPQGIQAFPKCTICSNFFFKLNKKDKQIKCTGCGKTKKCWEFCKQHPICENCVKTEKYEEIVLKCRDSCQLFYDWSCRCCFCPVSLDEKIVNPNHQSHFYCSSCFKIKKKMKEQVKCESCMVYYKRSSSKKCRFCKEKFPKNTMKNQLCSEKKHFLCDNCFKNLDSHSAYQIELWLKCPSCILFYRDTIRHPAEKNKVMFFSPQRLEVCFSCKQPSEIRNSTCFIHFLCETCFANPQSEAITTCKNCQECLTPFDTLGLFRDFSQDSYLFHQNDSRTMLPRKGEEFGKFQRYSLSPQPRDKRHNQFENMIKCNMHLDYCEIMECKHPLCESCINESFSKKYKGFILDIFERRDLMKLNTEAYTINCYFPNCFNKACIPFAMVKKTAISILQEKDILISFADYYSLLFEGIKLHFEICLVCNQIRPIEYLCWVCSYYKFKEPIS